MPLEPFVAEVKNCVRGSDHLFAANYRMGLHTEPIPFFGNPLRARILTIGVNPSAEEFTGGRWPQTEMPSAELSQRLKSYFETPAIPPHPWFRRWSNVLADLGCSYTTEAAHLDLSPRATIAMRIVPHADLFIDMVRNDAQWMFGLLQQCVNARVVMLAGCVTKRWHAHQLFAQALPPGFALLQRPMRRTGGSIHALTIPGRIGTTPLFFSSSSPSDPDSSKLSTNLRPYYPQILAALAQR